MTSILQYAVALHREVNGWMGLSALGMTTAFSLWQHEQGHHGAVGEIGIHHGKYFIGLALLRGEDEYAVAIDLFEDQHLNIDWSGRGDREIFTNHLSRLGISLERLAIHKANSLDLSTLDLLKMSEGQHYRLFSIDGGHQTPNVLHDLEIVESALSSHGIAVLDDFYNGDWPGVNEGFFQYLPRGKLRPLIYGDNKLFLCPEEGYPDLLAWLKSEILPLTHQWKEVTLGGFPCYHAASPTVGEYLAIQRELKELRKTEPVPNGASVPARDAV